jgi:hypothetical protein
VQTGGTLSATPGNTSLIVVNGIGQTVAGGSGNNIVIAAGTNDTLNASQSGQKLIALGQSGDVLNGQTSNTSGIDKLIAVKGTVVGGDVSNLGNSCLACQQAFQLRCRTRARRVRFGWFLYRNGRGSRRRHFPR